MRSGNSSGRYEGWTAEKTVARVDDFGGSSGTETRLRDRCNGLWGEVLGLEGGNRVQKDW